jgi:glutamine amidotransferase
MSKSSVVVIDYGLGNLRSVSQALEKAGVQPEITGDPGSLHLADAVILPGVGAGDAAMCALRERGLVEPLREFASSGRPFLGICLGLQLLMDSTEEGETECLGIVPGKTRKLPAGLTVPHMGWNGVEFRMSHPVFDEIPGGSHFYFVHSYYVEPEDQNLAAGITEYGASFCSVLVRDNLVATQFHPEKSGTLGLKVYENFIGFALPKPGSYRRRNG